jgi:hypothetical protein
MAILSFGNLPINFLKKWVSFLPRLLVIADTIVQVSKPFFSMLQRWLFSGELQDPFSEFFVAVNPELAHLEYLRPSSGGNASLTGDGGFGGLAGEEASPDSDALESGMRLWEGKYQFRKGMLPRFVGETFGKKVRLVTATPLGELEI